MLCIAKFHPLFLIIQGGNLSSLIIVIIMIRILMNSWDALTSLSTVNFTKSIKESALNFSVLIHHILLVSEDFYIFV